MNHDLKCFLDGDATKFKIIETKIEELKEVVDDSLTAYKVYQVTSLELIQNTIIKLSSRFDDFQRDLQLN